MSQMGHPRRFELAPGTSGLPLIPAHAMPTERERLVRDINGLRQLLIAVG
jgi:hypothetical protein